MSNIQPDPMGGFLQAFFGQDVIGGFVRLAEALEDNDERIRQRDALRNTVKNLTILYEQGKLSKQGYLNALEAILEEPKTITVDSEIQGLLNKLRKI